MADMADTTLSTDQADTLRKMISMVLDKPCVCHIYDDPNFHYTSKDRRCHRCRLMWDIRGAWPKMFASTAEIWAMSQKGPA